MCGEAFLIGSEMIGLSTVRDDNDRFPFVDHLVWLTSQIREIVGAGTKLTYAADWTEYFGYHPQDGSNDLLYHLDPLWAHSEIDAVAIDNYMPISDWRIGGDPGNPDIHSQTDSNYLQAYIESGEGFDWYYASEADRIAGIRTPITDGLGEPWVWRYKDIRSWWSMPHHERINGIRSSSPTQWIPQSKPVLFSEIGCAAITMGANQPNVFADPKSDDSGLPRFSTGARSDLVQYRFLSAQLDYWSQDGNNPDSAVYGGKMIDTGYLFLWAWDARPFPQFPADNISWSDGINWHTGHWLNGRLGGCPVDELVTAIAADYGEVLQASCDGFLDGYVVQGPVSARDALEPLASLFGLHYSEEQDEAAIVDTSYSEMDIIASKDLVQQGDEPLIIRSREHVSELPVELGLGHKGVFSSFEQEDSYSRRLVGESDRMLHLNVPAILPSSAAIGALDARLRDIWQERERLEIGLSNRYLHLSPGDVITLDASQENEYWRIESIEDGDFRRLQLRAVCRAETLPIPIFGDRYSETSNLLYGSPQLIAMNLPVQPEISTPRFHIALFAEPWARQYAIWSSPALSDFALRKTVTGRAQLGNLLQPLGPGPEGRWDNGNEIAIHLTGDPLESKSAAQILNGANAAAILCVNGDWEILQFANADLQAEGDWVLSGLLRAQLGSDNAMHAGAEIGAPIVFLDAGVETIELAELEAGLELNWRAGPADDPVSAATYTQITHTHQNVSKRPYSPVNLEAAKSSNDEIVLSWTRRSRISSDSWDAVEIPLGETQENYLVEIFDGGGSSVRSINVQVPHYTYTAAEQMLDHGQLVSEFDCSVAQIASSGLPGTARRLTTQL